MYRDYFFYGLTICALTLTPLTAGADIFVSGLNALDRTHYASAYRSFKPLADEGIAEAQNNIGSVSYTHLTLPTICSV